MTQESQGIDGFAVSHCLQKAGRFSELQIPDTRPCRSWTSSNAIQSRGTDCLCITSFCLSGPASYMKLPFLPLWIERTVEGWNTTAKTPSGNTSPLNTKFKSAKSASWRCLYALGTPLGCPHSTKGVKEGGDKSASLLVGFQDR